MVKICFLSWPIYSHVKNSRNIVEKLIEKGYKIYYFGDKKFKYLLNDLHIEFIDYHVRNKLLKLKFTNFKYVKLKKIKQINTEKELIDFIKLQCEFKIDFYNVYFKSVEKLCKKIKFDFIFHDACSYHGKILSNNTGIPACGYLTSLLFDEKYISNNIYSKLTDIFHFNLKFLKNTNEKELLDYIDKIHNDVSKRYKVPKFPITGSVDTCEDYNIIFSSDIFQPKTNKTNNYICRPKIFNNVKEYSEKSNSNLIYISTGAYLVAKSEFYNFMISAFKDTDYNVIISIPTFDESQIIKLPKNIQVVRQTNQLEILKNASVFITHGGYNGICEAIYNYVPMLVYPLTNDQYLNARLIEDYELGYNIKNMKLNKKNLLLLVENLKNNEHIINNLKKHNLAMRNSRELDSSIEEIINNLV